MGPLGGSLPSHRPLRTSLRERIRSRDELGKDRCPHRLFLPGDLVFIEWTNGGGERQTVYSVSGKGFPIRGIYLGYQTSRYRWRRVAPREVKLSWDQVEAMARQVARPAERVIATAGNRAMFAAGFDRGPLRIVELPESLVGHLPDSPDVRRFVVENLGARSSARRVSANSPALLEIRPSGRWRCRSGHIWCRRRPCRANWRRKCRGRS